jgi:hypothetical protein
LKRSILLSLFAALALAVGFSTVASLGGDSTALAAKKGKSCKKGKGKGKAGKSSTATAQAKKKGKKGKGCKKPKAPTKTEELTEGRYSDAGNGVELNLLGVSKGFFASVKFQIPASCATLAYESGQPSPADLSASGVEVKEKGTIAVAGEPFDVAYTLSVTNALSYKLTVEANAKDPSVSCGFSGTITGNLTKQGG